MSRFPVQIIADFFCLRVRACIHCVFSQLSKWRPTCDLYIPWLCVFAYVADARCMCAPISPQSASGWESHLINARWSVQDWRDSDRVFIFLSTEGANCGVELTFMTVVTTSSVMNSNLGRLGTRLWASNTYVWAWRSINIYGYVSLSLHPAD